MDPNWQEIEENEQIKTEFADYHSGLARHKQERWVLPPDTLHMLREYKVRSRCAK